MSLSCKLVLYLFDMRNLTYWLLSCLLLTLLIGLVFGSSQQVLRQTANDPQIQIAEDTAAILSTGKNPIDVVSKESVDVNSSLAPFVMVFDNNGKLLASNANIKNAASEPPKGVFQFDRDYFNSDLVGLKKKISGEDSSTEKIFTWQPAQGIRLASVLVKYDGGIVLSGRSLRETEYRTHKLFQMAFLAWAIGIGAISAAFFLTLRFKK